MTIIVVRRSYFLWRCRCLHTAAAAVEIWTSFIEHQPVSTLSGCFPSEQMRYPLQKMLHAVIP